MHLFYLKLNDNQEEKGALGATKGEGAVFGYRLLTGVEKDIGRTDSYPRI